MRRPLQQMSDAELVSLCVNGDTEAFGQLVERYEQAVYATAFYYIGRHGSAEDVAQEAFFAAYRSLPTLRDTSRFAPWLREVTCRTAANWLRKHGKRISSETPLPYRRTANVEDIRLGPIDSAEREERFDEVQRAIDSLPERYRLTVILRYLQDLSYAEIAAFTGQSKEEVRGVLQRAMTQLRRTLARAEADAKGESQWDANRKSK